MQRPHCARVGELTPAWLVPLPLDSLAQNGHTAIVELLTKNGAKVNAALKDGVTPLLYAVEKGHTKLAEALYCLAGHLTATASTRLS